MSKRKSVIIRAPRDGDNPYVAIRRASLQDDRLSFEARGVLAYLLSKPSDWEISPTELQQAGGCGRDRIYRILKDLETCGYLEREQAHVAEDGASKGRFLPITYTLREKPHPENPYTVEPYTAEPYTENPQHTYKESFTENKNEQNASLTRAREDATPAPPPAQERPDLDLIGAWCDALPNKPLMNAYAESNRRLQEMLLDEGVTADDVRGYVTEQYDPDRGDGFWIGKAMSFRHVAEAVMAWKHGKSLKQNGGKSHESPDSSSRSPLGGGRIGRAPGRTPEPGSWLPEPVRRQLAEEAARNHGAGAGVLGAHSGDHGASAAGDSAD